MTVLKGKTLRHLFRKTPKESVDSSVVLRLHCFFCHPGPGYRVCWSPFFLHFLIKNETQVEVWKLETVSLASELSVVYNKNNNQSQSYNVIRMCYRSVNSEQQARIFIN